MARTAKPSSRRGRPRSQLIAAKSIKPWDLQTDERFDDPGFTASLSMFFGELSHALHEKDVEGAAALKAGIQELFRVWADDEEIDFSLAPVLRKSRKRAAG